MQSRVEWIESFEVHLAALRPRLPPSLLSAISSCAWDSQGQSLRAADDVANEYSASMNGGKRAVWSVQPTPELVKQLSSAADTAHANADATLEDAVLLFDASRYPRACALAVLAEEEFGKAVVLRSCASQPRWDSAVFAALRHHSEKQGIALAGRTYFVWLQRNLQLVERLNSTALIPAMPSLFPSEEAWKALIAEASNAIQSSVRDRTKQDALYVGVDRFGRTSDPAQLAKDDAQRCIDDAGKIKLYVDATVGMLSQTDAVEALGAIGYGRLPAYFQRR